MGLILASGSGTKYGQRQNYLFCYGVRRTTKSIEEQREGCMSLEATGSRQKDSLPRKTLKQDGQCNLYVCFVYILRSMHIYVQNNEKKRPLIFKKKQGVVYGRIWRTKGKGKIM